MKETIREEFAYALTKIPYHLRQCKYYEGLFFVTIGGVRVYIDCNHSGLYEHIEIPKVTNYEKQEIDVEVDALRREIRDRVREHLAQNNGLVRPIITIEEIEEMGLIDKLKRKHNEEKPGRDLWDYEADKGVCRVFTVVDKRMVDVKIGERDQQSPMFDLVDMETKEELSVWGFGRLLNAFEIDGVYVVEYNGKSEKGHSFWITNVTKEYKAGVAKKKK